MTAAAAADAFAPGGLAVQRRSGDDRVVALAGNPNVGKSTIFNALTGMKQHTGNWPGKTVVNAQGRCHHNGRDYVLVDIPGCYSLMAHSVEEEVARDFICFGGPDAVVVVCDATCIERNLNLVLQVMEAMPHVAVAVNLMDEARKKSLTPDLKKLADRLHVPVIGTTARSNQGLKELLNALELLSAQPDRPREYLVRYPAHIEWAINMLSPLVEAALADRKKRVDIRWLCARLLDANAGLLDATKAYLDFDVTKAPGVAEALAEVHATLEGQGTSRQRLQDDLAAAFVTTAEQIAKEVRVDSQRQRCRLDRRLDQLFTSKATGFPIMLLMLLGIFWLTITGANVPSELLADGLFYLEDQLALGMAYIGVSQAIIDLLAHGVYRVMAWVVSVMLPPMAIFFPLFTLLEDFGYLPRVAFNLDRCFKCCAACGKQALTMWVVDNGMRNGKGKPPGRRRSRLACGGVIRY